MTGFSAAEVVGQRLAEFLRIAESEGEVGEDLQQAIDTGHGVSLDVKHTRKDGQTYWASLSLTPAFDEAVIGTKTKRSWRHSCRPRA